MIPQARPFLLAGILLTTGTPCLAAQAPGQRTTQPVPGTGVEFTLAFVPGGTFRMGSPSDEPGRDDDEGPVHLVTLSPVWMTVHEITHDQFGPFRYRRLDSPDGARPEIPFDADAVTRPSPPYEDPSHGMAKGDHPATGMTRLAALRYARWLSEKTGRLFRLPTEAEWEYACRAGSAAAYGFGADPPRTTEYAWYEGNSGGVYHRVGEKLPNAWGLHDMHGNVAEWVMDTYDRASYAAPGGEDPVTDPLIGNPARGQGIVRGGAFDDEPARLRCAERFPETPAWKRRDPQLPKSRWWNTDSPHVGFRLVSPARDYTIEELMEYWNGILGDTPREEETWTDETS